RRFEEDLAARRLEPRVQRIDAEERRFGGLPLHRSGDAEAVLIVLVLVEARNARSVRRIELRESRPRGRVVRAEAGERGGGRGAAILFLGVLPAHRARAFVEQLAPGVGR